MAKGRNTAKRSATANSLGVKATKSTSGGNPKSVKTRKV
jgi:hypothetical protein